MKKTTYIILKLFKGISEFARLNWETQASIHQTISLHK